MFFLVHSFVGLVKYLFTINGVKVFLSNRLCQDPLENFFGQQRQRGGVSDNPNSAEFLKNTQSLRIVNSMCRKAVKGNCRGRKSKQTIDEADLQPLPKRKYSHK